VYRSGLVGRARISKFKFCVLRMERHDEMPPE
jgi:hypothetical protein